MSESADFDPGYWRGHDFGAARKHYDAYAGRSYDDAKVEGKSQEDVLPVSLSTDSPNPLVILCDVTGSMGEWPATIFSKLPYLELEGQEYLGKNMEICFGAVGDAYSDEYPLQARSFTKGLDLKAKLKELIIEGHGGGQLSETYEIAALYFARNVNMPKAINPICIFIGDEAPYDFADEGRAKRFAHVNLQKSRMSTREIFDELKRKFSVYLIRKPYNVSSGDTMSGDDKKIYGKWLDLLDEDHIAILPEAARVVDVIFGILAKETSRIEYFREELEDRQKPEQVKTVYKSLATIHAIGDNNKKALPGRSVHKNIGNGGNSKPLL